MKIIFATGNKGKLREAREILGPDYELLSSADAGVTEDIPETGSSFQENSLQKAEYIWKKCGVDCFSDDSGLEVDALGGAPGIYSARYGSMDAAEGSGSHDFDRNIDKLLHELTVLDTKALLEGKPAPARTARFRCVVTLMLDGEPHFFDGTAKARLPTSARATAASATIRSSLPTTSPDSACPRSARNRKTAFHTAPRP